MNLLNQAKVMVAAPVLESHIQTTMEEMVLVASRLQMMIARIRHMLQPKVNHASAEADLISESHGTPNSSVMKANLFRTLEKFVH